MAHVPQIQVREPDVQTGKTSVQSEKIGNAPVCPLHEESDGRA